MKNNCTKLLDLSNNLVILHSKKELVLLWNHFNG